MTDDAVSSVLGSVLMLSILAMLLPGALLLKGAIGDEMSAQREAAEHAAYCARHPEVHAPACPPSGPMEGYDCREVEADTWLCSPSAPTAVTPPVNATPKI
jgi:hypothetical protein